MAENDRSARFAAGKEVFDAVGGEAADAMVSELADVAPELAHQVVAYGFGDIYSRPELTPDQRQLVTLGVLTALGGCERQLAVHVGAALNVGLEPEQIIEAILHASVYCGFPRAVNATRVAKGVFGERGLLPLR